MVRGRRSRIRSTSGDGSAGSRAPASAARQVPDRPAAAGLQGAVRDGRIGFLPRVSRHRHSAGAALCRSSVPPPAPLASRALRHPTDAPDAVLRGRVGGGDHPSPDSVADRPRRGAGDDARARAPRPAGRSGGDDPARGLTRIPSSWNRVRRRRGGDDHPELPKRLEAPLGDRRPGRPFRRLVAVPATA